MLCKSESMYKQDKTIIVEMLLLQKPEAFISWFLQLNFVVKCCEHVNFVITKADDGIVLLILRRRAMAVSWAEMLLHLVAWGGLVGW